MDANEQLENIVRYRRRFGQEDSVSLGGAVEKLMKNKIRPQQKRYGTVIEAWGQLVAGTLAEHCTVVGIEGGNLKIRADSAAYRQELEWCREELLRQLQRRCGSSKIKGIKLVSR